MSEVKRYYNYGWVMKPRVEASVHSDIGELAFVLCADFDAEHALRLEAEHQVVSLRGTLEATRDARDAAQYQVMELREQLAASNDKIDKAWNRGHGLKGEFIPGALDAWKRPVKQHLPYDFSGNPGASATQYCNGWNDAGGYWKNHAEDLQLKLDAAMELLAKAEEWFVDASEWDAVNAIRALFNTTSTEGKDHE